MHRVSRHQSVCNKSSTDTFLCWQHPCAVGEFLSTRLGTQRKGISPYGGQGYGWEVEIIEKVRTWIQESLSCPLRGYLLGKMETGAELSPVPWKHRITPGMVTIPEKNCFWDSCLHPLQEGSQIHVPLQPGLTIKPLQPTLGGTRTKPCPQVLSPSETQPCAEARTGLLCELDKTGFEFELCQPLIKETWESLITIWSPSYFVYSIQRWFKKLDLINKVHWAI